MNWGVNEMKSHANPGANFVWMALVRCSIVVLQ